MPAYIVVEAAITDGERFGAYAKAVPALVAEYGGDYLVLGGEQHALEGDWTGRRIVIHQWPSIEQAQAFWHSDAYAEIKQLREGTGEFRVALVDGLVRETLE